MGYTNCCRCMYIIYIVGFGSVRFYRYLLQIYILLVTVACRCGVEHRAEDQGSESVYAKYYMSIGCKWMYVYETVAVEFGGGMSVFMWSQRVEVHTMYNVYKYCGVGVDV